ncbi:hypothetical protein [Mesorhizobium sp. LNJC405B00]|uniref:hypothetical protein n=1 Tax=unclassified Mesorhizobium TaxID=325217 RepID=UPI0003CF1139|nr:hypothetical protein [Mesorhizobium sp. LNJC405B00]ESY02783.1 hypothetical protein X755_02470 [Mesorhizobium sp. LNJC405B00]
MQDEATRRQWREHKRKWREANRERNREIDNAAYYRNRDTINQKRKDMRTLFAEWRKEVRAKAEGSQANG